MQQCEAGMSKKDEFKHCEHIRMQQSEAGTNEIEAVTEAKIRDSEAENRKKDEQNKATISEL
eukprot:10434067-Alexandrium_andersonii.AAC.1